MEVRSADRTIVGMRVLIVDDEPVSRKVLREELETLSEVEVIGEADNGETALQAIAATKPDLVFLDIHMPVMSGFQLLDRLNGGYMPTVIMITAYDQYAIQAFEAGAVDYLLKPIRQDRLMQSLQRAKRVAQNPAQAAENMAELQSIGSASKASGKKPRKIVGKLGEEYFLISPDEVLAFQAEGDVTWILTARQRYAATQNLRAIEERMAGSSFRRIHRNALVNVEQIRKMSIMSSQRWLVTLNNGLEFIVSKRQAKNVRDVLDW